MIKTARQLKDLIRNLSREKSADAQILMRNYMMERFLERISLSEYRDKFILKGGMLVAAMVGLDARSTMDLDATIKGANVNVEDIENLISSIVTVPIDDGVKFQLKSISEIMDEAEYPGIRVSMSTTFDGVVTPLKIDISTGDAITPREVRYSFKLMLEDRSIDIWAYNLETVLAEKLETIITRTTTNTRMRDFYDIYILEQLHGTTLNPKILHDALLATAHKRGSEKYLNQAEEVFDEVENDSVMQKLWEAYRKKFSYASDLEWDVIMKAIRRLYVLCEKGISLREGFVPVLIQADDETLLECLVMNADPEHDADCYEFDLKTVEEYRKKMLSAPVKDGKAILEELTGQRKEEAEDDDLDWEEEVLGEMEGGEPNDRFANYWNDDTGMTYPLILAKIPVKNPWEIFAYLPFGNWNECPDTPDLMAVAKYWFEQHGAIPAAMSHDELEFELPTPISKERAMEVAVEQYGFCPDLDQNEDGSIGSLAGVLWQSTVWYFWWD